MLLMLLFRNLKGRLMLNSRDSKVLFYAFLLILAGGFLFIGSSTETLNQGINNYPVNATAATYNLIGLGLILLGLLLGVVAACIRPRV